MCSCHPGEASSSGSTVSTASNASTGSTASASTAAVPSVDGAAGDAGDVSGDQPGSAWLDTVRWDEHGLVPAIAQDADSGRVLMFAWMNREALAETARTGRAVYWSRSRGRLWRKGEESGHVQSLRELRIDCDQDVVLLKVVQQGGIACHTGRESCFFSRFDDGRWVEVDPVLKDPELIYK